VVGKKAAASPNPHPPTHPSFLPQQQQQQHASSKSACMTLPVRRLDTSVASCIVDAIHNSPPPHPPRIADPAPDQTCVLRAPLPPLATSSPSHPPSSLLPLPWCSLAASCSHSGLSWPGWGLVFLALLFVAGSADVARAISWALVPARRAV